MDWLCCLLSCVGWLLMAHHRRAALWLFTANCLLWIAFLSSVQIWSMVLLQLFYLAVNVRTLIAWRAERAP